MPQRGYFTNLDAREEDMGVLAYGLRTVAIALFVGVVGASAASAQNPFGQQFDFNKVIHDEMSRDDRFENLQVEGSMLDGYVTLEGYVDNIWQRDRLIEITQNVNGVKGVIDQLEVVGLSIDSERLAKAAAMSLYRDEVADLYELKVVTDNYGRAKISGEVDSKQERDAALDALKRVKGVAYVQGDIEVVPAGERDDLEVEKDLNYALYDNVLVEEQMVEARVNSSVATLEGNVGSESEILVIEEISKDVEGVDEVRVVELTVVPRYDRAVVFKMSTVEEDYADAALARMVDQANYYDTRVFSYNIDVDARNGVIELKGVAKNEEARQAAVENARNTIGVKEVLDNISVDEFSPDQELLAE